MSQALAAYDAGRWDEARKALESARAQRPDAPEVAETLARVDEAQRLDSLNRLQKLAETLESAENWHSAASTYRSMLEVDENVQVARDGLRRAEALATLYDRLDAHLERPERLSDAGVLREVESLLAQARRVAAPGAELQRRINGLGELVSSFGQPVLAELRSDANTEVTIYRVGQLGRFETRQVERRPGSYTVHGSRPGYRDVRLEWVIEPGKEPAPLDVRCEEML